MDVRVERYAAAHLGLVTPAGLQASGMSRAAADRAVAHLRPLHAGVFLTGHGPLTRHQRHLAATLSAPGSVLSHASAADLWGLRAFDGPFEVVTRPGSGGPRRHDGLLVCRSKTVAAATELVDEIPVTTVARTVVDLAAYLDTRARDRMVADALRLGITTTAQLRTVVVAHRGRRGTAGLLDRVRRLEGLQVARTRSHAEVHALELIAQAGIPTPQVNVRRAGEEADLSWPTTRRSVEIDGPQFHRDVGEDARKDSAWRRGGWTVRRIPSDEVFEAPERLVALARWASGATGRPEHLG